MNMHFYASIDLLISLNLDSQPRDNEQSMLTALDRFALEAVPSILTLSLYKAVLILTLMLLVDNSINTQ